MENLEIVAVRHRLAGILDLHRKLGLKRSAKNVRLMIARKILRTVDNGAMMDALCATFEELQSLCLQSPRGESADDILGEEIRLWLERRECKTIENAKRTRKRKTSSPSQ